MSQLSANIPRIQPPEELANLLAALRQQGQTIGLANGCFDILHVGHIRCLEEGARHADVLILAVNSDESVRRSKGPGRPVHPLAERMEVLAGLRCVSHVTWFAEDTAAGIIRLLRPHVVIKGTDYTPEQLPERQVIAEIGARIVIAGDAKTHSSTQLAERLR
ncbi:MAG: Bifunctional protein HldE [Myxococcota bacterium]|nr:Bifunctional protein HldE [Myxococcota bacterium]